MLRFPADQIHDEDTALDWWENEFAPFCESLGGHFDSALLVRMFVASIRDIRRTSLDELLTVAEVARETGYSARQVSRWLKDGKIPNLGSDTAPRVRRADVISHKKCSLPRRSPIRIMDTAQDIARSVANS
jgi:AraC-like DNA-binding protein